MHQQETTQMTKYNKMWQWARKAHDQVIEVGGLKIGGGMSLSVLCWEGAKYAWHTYNVTNYGPDTLYDLKNKMEESHAHLDEMLKKIVTAPYKPEVPNGREYVPRQQDGALEKDLQENIASETDFFLLMGESGSGKTTMMQHLLKKNYKEGVIFVAVHADKLVDVPKNKVRDVVEAAVLEQFEECKDHPRHKPSFTGFIKHANEVRKRAKKGKKAHPLIIYITLDTKEATELSYETMGNIAVAVGGMASDLSSKQNCCKTILEFSKTGISDTLKKIRTDFDRFEVGAMTEEELLAIGEQLVLKGPLYLAMTEAERKAFLVKKDPQNLIGPYLKHYHDWLGGQTKTLAGFIKTKVGSKSMQSLCCLFVQYDY